MAQTTTRTFGINEGLPVHKASRNAPFLQNAMFGAPAMRSYGCIVQVYRFEAKQNLPHRLLRLTMTLSTLATNRAFQCAGTFNKSLSPFHASWARNTSSSIFGSISRAANIIQTGASFQTAGKMHAGYARAGIAVYVTPNNLKNISLPLKVMPTVDAYTSLSDKAIMLGILVGRERYCASPGKLVVLSDCLDSVYRLRDKFAAPDLEIRHVARKHVRRANWLARKAAKEDETNPPHQPIIR